MKKIKLLCALFLILPLVACGGGKEKINVKEKNTVKEYMNYEILYSERTTKIEPRILNGYYTYYKAKKTGNILVDLVMKIENISDKEISLNDLKVVFKIDDNEYAATKILEKSDTTLSAGGSIATKETKIVHMYAEVDLKTNLTNEIQFNLTANEKEAELIYKISDLKPQKNYQKSGYTLKDENAEITFKKIKITDTLNPSKPSSFYRYYKTSNNKTFVALEVSIKNIGKESLSSSKLLGTKIFVDGVQHNGEIIIEDEKQANLTTTSTIKAGEKRKAYLVAEIASKDKSKPIEVSVYYAGQDVYIKK